MAFEFGPVPLLDAEFSYSIFFLECAELCIEKRIRCVEVSALMNHNLDKLWTLIKECLGSHGHTSTLHGTDHQANGSLQRQNSNSCGNMKFF